jgi:hypothetical protein
MFGGHRWHLLGLLVWQNSTVSLCIILFNAVRVCSALMAACRCKTQLQSMRSRDAIQWMYCLLNCLTTEAAQYTA